MNAPNAPLAYKILDHIDAHPEQWNQTTWFRESECGTAGCFAGWAVVLTGHDIEFGSPDGRGRRYYASVDGDPDSLISEVAASELGIDGMFEPCLCVDECRCCESASDALFAATNSRADLDRLVPAIFGPRPNGGEGSNRAVTP